jgi:tetratricopeptide (TPR) repeat protein
MGARAEVFISATTRELRSYREEVKNALLTLGIFPIEQTNFRLAHGPLTAKLRSLIAPCDAVIHLAGFYYGAEPSQRPSGEPRRSYTQIEYDVARELRNPLFLFLAAENCGFDDSPEQSEEERTLQLAHRRAIEECDDVYYSFANHEDLARLVRELELPDRSAEAPRRVVNLPYNSLGPLFKGRDAALADLRRRLRSGPCQAIHGLGGVGKTRLAIEYAWRHASDYTALLFVSARSPVELRANLAGLCNPLVLNLAEQARPEQAVRLAAAFRWLSEHPGWLLILDSIDTPEAAAEVERTLPQLQGGLVIITSRISDWSPAVQTLELDVLSEKDAAAFFLERTKSKRMKAPGDASEAVTLARELGGLALALEQAGAYVAKTHLSVSEYRRCCESHKTEVLAWHDERLMKYASSVAVTWQTTIEQLALPERKLLNMLAWLAPEPIPVSLLEGVQVDGTSARDALAGLAGWSLARWTADGDAFKVHRLVQKITRHRLRDNPAQNAARSAFTILTFVVQRLVRKIMPRFLPDTEKLKSLEAALATLEVALPSPDWDEKGWQMWNLLVPHCRVLLDRLRDHFLEPKATRMMRYLGVFLEGGAEYDQAEAFLRRALQIDERSLGRHHPDVAIDLNHLARVLSETNRLAEAEPLFRKALAIIEKLFGPDHAVLAPSLSQLARLLSATSRLEAAEPLCLRALAITERTFGPDHPFVGTSLNELAELLRAMNRLADAEPLYLRALAIGERSLGPDHPDFATFLNNYAELLRATNRLAEAEPLFRRALEINEKRLRPDHPDVARDLNNLALLLSATDRLGEAEPLYSRALAITERTFGPDHPKVAVCLNNIADLLHTTNRLAEAESLYLRSLAIGEKSLGPDNSGFAACLNNYAELLRATNRPAQAELLYRRALRVFAAFARHTGHEHAHFRTTIDNYAGLISAMGLSQGAIAARVRSAIEGESEESA